MMPIQPQYLSLNELLTGRLFRIPEYQHSYIWGARQREDLFGDISKIADSNDDDIHFMATIVGLRREKREIMTDVHQVVEVVDGQQRVTTLILLLRAVANALNESDAVQRKTRNDLNETLVKPDKLSLLFLFRPTTTPVITSRTICAQAVTRRPRLQPPSLIGHYWKPLRTASAMSRIDSLVKSLCRSN